MSSNIKFSSNLFPCKENIEFDLEFIREITDYHKLDNLKKYKYTSNLPILSVIQERILQEGLRCKNAKNDPCWGIQNSECGHKFTNKCINIQCQYFESCRPNFDKRELSLWKIDQNAIDIYGNPKSQEKYYLIKPVSVNEKNSYFNNPTSNAKKHKVLKKKEEKAERTIIGYRRLRFSDYCDQQNEPIYEDELSIVSEKTGRKYGTETINIATFLREKERKKTVEEEQNYKNFESVEENIVREEKSSKLEKLRVDSGNEFAEQLKEGIINKDSILINKQLKVLRKKEYLIEESGYKLKQKDIKDKEITIVTSDKGRMLYLASVLNRRGIEFGYDGTFDLNLHDYAKSLDASVQDLVIDISIIEEEKRPPQYYTNLYNLLVNTHGEIYLIDLSGKEFIIDSKTKRWISEGINGVVYYSVNLNDLCIETPFEYGEELNLEETADGTYILKNELGEEIGTGTDEFTTILKTTLKNAGVEYSPNKLNDIFFLEDSIECIAHLEYSTY